MGGTLWSDDHYHQAQNLRAASGKSAFAYSAAVKAAAPHDQKIHDKLNPLGVKLRESCDSVDHPESLAIAVFFDVTGSMLEVPVTLQKKLPSLMGLLIRKSYVDHPQIMVGAVGDAFSDRATLQVGQFESGVEIDEDLNNLWLEGGGGGQVKESYAFPLYFMAKHTAIDCWKKRQKKGYLFIIGDEMSHEATKAQILSVIGDTVEADITPEEAVKMASEMYNVFFIIPNMTSHWTNSSVHDFWKKLLGERFLKMEDPEAVCELIATTVGLMEGRVDKEQIDQDLADFGVSSSARGAISKALVPVAAGALAPASGQGTGLTTL